MQQEKRLGYVKLGLMEQHLDRLHGLNIQPSHLQIKL